MCLHSNPMSDVICYGSSDRTHNVCAQVITHVKFQDRVSRFPAEAPRALRLSCLPVGHADKSLHTQLAVDTREVFLDYRHSSSQTTDVTFNLQGLQGAAGAVRGPGGQRGHLLRPAWQPAACASCLSQQQPPRETALSAAQMLMWSPGFTDAMGCFLIHLSALKDSMRSRLYAICFSAQGTWDAEECLW